MSRRAIYHTVIFQDFVIDEIQMLQKELCQIDEKKWSFSNVINLLLRFYFGNKNEPVYTQKFSFLQEYLTGKRSFLNKFISDILVSSMEVD